MAVKKKLTKKSKSKPEFSIEIRKKTTKKKVTKKKTVKKKKITKKKPQPHSKWHDHYLEIIKNLLKAGKTIPEVCLSF